MNGRMRPLQSFLPSVLRTLLRNGPMSQEKLECAWQAAVGPAIARVTTVRWKNDSLVEVATSDDAWRRELKRSLPEIAARLRELVGNDRVAVVRLARRAGDGHH